jgi:hypothetical protein
MPSLIHVETGWKAPPTRYSQLNDVYSYWDARRCQRRRPSRADINPGDLRKALSNLFLIDVVGREFRFRLAGSNFAMSTGRRMTGDAIEQIFPPAYCKEVRNAWMDCADRSTTVFGSGQMWVPERDFLQWQGIVLPLGGEHEAPNMLLGAIVFSAKEGGTPFYS